jgi:uncharacterized membrane protein
MAGPKQAKPASDQAGNGQAGSATATKSGTRSGNRGRTSGQGQRGQASSRNQAGRRNQAGAREGRGQAGAGAATVARNQSARRAPQAPESRTPAVPRFRAPQWLQWATLVLSVAGLGMSIYLTIAHYTSTSVLACSDKGYINCAKVTTSAESVVFGVFPVAVLGLAFYVFMVAINTPWAWRSQWAPIWVARTAGIITGIGFVLYLIYAEVIEIGNICLLCTIVHIITFLLFVLLISVASTPFGSHAGAKPATARN